MAAYIKGQSVAKRHNESAWLKGPQRAGLEGVRSNYVTFSVSLTPLKPRAHTDSPKQFSSYITQNALRPHKMLSRATGGWGSQNFYNNRHIKAVRPTNWPLYPLGDTTGTYYCYRLSRPQGYSAIGSVKSMKKLNESIGNRTATFRPQPIAPSRTFPPTPLQCTLITMRNILMFWLFWPSDMTVSLSKAKFLCIAAAHPSAYQYSIKYGIPYNADVFANVFKLLIRSDILERVCNKFPLV
jgi:hypothetical protein